MEDLAVNTADLKSLMCLLRYVLADCGTWCCTSTTLDFNTIERRVTHEGISFLTISLPSFGSDFERSLDLGMVPDDAFMGFQKRGALPELFRGLLQGVFDTRSGTLLDTPCCMSIYFIRQLTLMWKKILLPCSSERVEKAYVKYIQCENEVKEWERNVDQRTVDRFSRISHLLWDHDLSIIDRMVYDGDLKPRHGPGATADRIVGNGKFDLRTWPRRLEGYFPIETFAIANAGFSDVLDGIDFVEPENEMPVRVITVPKTLKTPRVIAIEPTAMQYVQQSILEILVPQLERSDILSGALGFTDQVPNQDRAREGSISGDLATLDLSEASDRVSNLLVRTMLKPYKSLAGAVEACRSYRADVPGKGIISLAKFASMGSALCFPIEAMVFLTVVLIGVEDALSRTLTRKDLQILKRVRIYGDDIIVPVEYVRCVVHALNEYGFVVNNRKSFWNGKFRESCGRDYYGGNDVTVVYCRRLLPAHRSNASEMDSAVSLRNQLYKAGLWQAAGYLDDYLGRLAPFPTVAETSPVLGRHSYLGYEVQKMHETLHKPLVKGCVRVVKKRKSYISGHGALLKFFLKRGSDPIVDRRHLERYGRPLSVDIKIGWASAT